MTNGFPQRHESVAFNPLGTGFCIRPGSVYDEASVRIAEDLGFELGMFSGSVASLAV